MKKIYCLIFVAVLFYICSVFAADFSIVKSPQKVNINNSQMEFEVYNIDGNNFFKLRDIAYVLNGTLSQFSVEYNETSRIIEVKTGFSYTSNESEMKTGADNSNSAVKSSQKININGEDKELLAYNIAGNNFFKLRDLGSALNFDVGYNESTNTVEVNSAKKEEKIVNITNVTVKDYHGIKYVELTSDNAINSYTSFTIYDEDNDRIVVDIPNSNVKYSNNQISVNDSDLKQIRIGDQGNNVYRFVLDIENDLKYRIVQSDDKKITIIALTKNINNIDLLENNDSTKLDDKKNSGDQVNSLNDNKNMISITSIKYSSASDKLTITGLEKFNYTDSRLDSPYRIVFDIEDAVLSIDGPSTITPSNKNISEIRFSQKDDKTVRVVIETTVELDYKVTSNNKNLEIFFEEPIQSLTYVSKKSYGLITLKDVDKDVFTTKSDSSNYQYTVKYSESRFSCDKETLKVNDDWVQSIKITTGKIVIQGQKGMEFTTKQDGSNVIITITKTSKTSTTTSTATTKTSKMNENFTVLIDAGHGGNDPGACNGTNYEKIYNLKIAMKLKDLLEDSGITVYCSRTSDTYLDRDDRVAFINEHDDADLFVSVHNNSSNNKNYNGTMVLYYDNDLQRNYGITSKEFAKIASSNLVDALNTKSWGIVCRDDLWVLTKSPLPAILCEVSFVSNDEELERLKTDKFQAAAAKALYESIMTAKEQMEK